MKTYLPIVALIVLLLYFISITTSCKKTDTSNLAPKEDLVLGKWFINRIQLKIFSGGVFVKDTIIPQLPKPQNFINFGSDGKIEYRYNTSVSEFGTYKFQGADSIIATMTNKVYKWKTLLLTTEIFTLFTTSTTDAFYPGSVVENYQTLVRFK